MPSVLLINVDELLVQRLAADPRWRVAYGTHKRSGEWEESPDPTGWDLIVDDCGWDRDPKRSTQIPSEEDLSRENIPRYWIPQDYTGQATRAKGIRLTQGPECWRISLSNAPEQYRDVEFNIEDKGGRPLIDFLREFLRDFEKRVVLRDGNNRWFGDGVLFTNAYNEPLVAMMSDANESDRLITINIPDRDRRVAALEYLCLRTAPKLWPSLYFGSFESARVSRLSVEKDRLTEEFEQRISTIDTEIAAEEEFYSSWVSIRFIGDEDLKLLVSQALADVFGFSVEDLDDKHAAAKNADLLIEQDGWSCLVEVSGSTNRNAQYPELDDFDKHAEQFTEAGGGFDARLLVFNDRYARSDDERAQTPTFSNQLVTEAEKRGIALIDTLHLLRAIERIHTGEMSAADFVDQVKRGSLIEFVD